MTDPHTAPDAVRQKYSRPPTWATALELRAVPERAAMAIARPLLDRLPRGDGHAVLVLPGFTADDRSTQPLRDLLRRLGYDARAWRAGVNVGPSRQVVAALRRQVTSAVADSGRISIVGWSLGGIYAREIARERPNDVRQVITLGSPIQMIVGDDSAPGRLWRSLRPLHVREQQRTVRDHERSPLRVPATSVYTRTDGVVNWRTCLVPTRPDSENIEVIGSHCGLGFNPAAVYAIADRLAQPDGQWAPFRAPIALRGLFPRPSLGPAVATGDGYGKVAAS